MMSPAGARGDTDEHAAQALLDDPEAERLLLALHGCTELPCLWETMRRLLDAFVPSDAAIFHVNFLDFSRTWCASRILATPKADKPAAWMQRRRAVDPMPRYIAERPGLPLFRLSEVIPSACELERSPFFRAFMVPEGWRYAACLLFWSGSRLHSQIALRRIAAQGDFTPGDMAMLGRLRMHFQTVLDRLFQVRRRGAPQIVRPQTASHTARTPAQVKDESGGCDPGQSTESASPRAPPLQPPGQSGMATTVPAAAVFSDKERAVLRLLVAGVSNEAAARGLGVTTHTIKWHLANIYTKLGVKNRTAAVSIALAMSLI